MEQWKCVRVCFFKGKLYNKGEVVSGEAINIPRHFKSIIGDKEGELGKERQNEPKVSLEDIMKDSPLLEQAKNLRSMNKAELCAYGRSMGLQFLAEEMTRAEMIRDCIEAKDKKGTTNQEMADMTKR
jgi:hypothetical protein